MGMIYKRGNTWWIKYYRNGKCFRESSGTTKKMVAKKLMDRREGEIAQGKVPSVLFEKVSFDELAEEFIMDYRINNKKSLDRAELSVEHLRTEFGGMRIPEITTPHIQRYVIVSDADLRLAAQRQHAYLESQLGTNLGTIADFDAKKSNSK